MIRAARCLVHNVIRKSFGESTCITKSLVQENFILWRNGQPTRSLHTSSPKYVNPILIAVLRPISKVAAILVGRGFRKWWQALPPKKRQIFIEHMKRNKYRYIGGTAVVGVAGHSYYDSHVLPAPITGRRRFVVFSPEQLKVIAQHSYAEEVGQYADHLLPVDHPMVDRVKRVGDRLLQANKNIPQVYTKAWRVTVIDQPISNCYVLPVESDQTTWVYLLSYLPLGEGVLFSRFLSLDNLFGYFLLSGGAHSRFINGDIVMFRGMMEMLENDDQVAIIMAHEMSHAILEHSSENLSRGYLTDVLILLPLAFIWAFIPSDGLALVTQWFLNRVVEIFHNLPYCRKLEEEADRVGLQLAAKACFDVREASVFWGKMSVLDEMKQRKDEVSADFAWLSTHPSNSERQESLDLQMEEALSIRNFCQCPRLSDKDPRQSIWKMQDHLKVLSSRDSKSL